MTTYGLLCPTCDDVLVQSTTGAYAFGTTPDHRCEGARP